MSSIIVVDVPVSGSCTGSGTPTATVEVVGGSTTTAVVVGVDSIVVAGTVAGVVVSGTVVSTTVVVVVGAVHVADPDWMPMRPVWFEYR